MKQRLIAVTLFTCLFAATRAEAQFEAQSSSPEDFHTELAMMWFTPKPELTLTTGNALVGTVDFVQEFGIAEEKFREIRTVIKPGRKHKIRFAYLPIKYEESAVLQRNVTFQNVTFPVSANATSAIKWDLYRFGYEWDFVRRSHGFVGVITELKYNKVQATVGASGVMSGQAQTLTASVDQRAPIPTIGGVARGYIGKYASVTGEFTGLKADRDTFRAKFYDFDISAAGHLGKNGGVQAGYRSITVDFLVDDDAGVMKMKGPYVGAFVRF
jgi:hypothetical protein